MLYIAFIKMKKSYSASMKIAKAYYILDKELYRWS